jgi:hypothetical protein
MTTTTTFKITGNDFEDFAPVVHALWEDGLLVTAHLSDDEKDWEVTAEAEDRATVDGVVEAVDIEGEVKVEGP